MTETVGYLCPKCLSWWTRYLCKDGKLYCKCEIPEEEWFYIYRKYYARGCGYYPDQKAIVSNKDLVIKLWASQIEFEGYYQNHIDKAKLKKVVKEFISKNKPELIDKWQLFYIGFKKAFSQASSNQWFERCPKCKYYINGRKCKKGHDWLSVQCEDFDLKQSIKKFLGIEK